jgi:hypothetical protein
MQLYREDYRHLNFDQMKYSKVVVQVLVEDDDDVQLPIAIDQEKEEPLELFYNGLFFV